MKAFKLTVIFVLACTSISIVILTIVYIRTLLNAIGLFPPYFIILIFSVIGLFLLDLFITTWYRLFLK